MDPLSPRQMRKELAERDFGAAPGEEPPLPEEAPVDLREHEPRGQQNLLDRPKGWEQIARRKLRRMLRLFRGVAAGAMEQAREGIPNAQHTAEAYTQAIKRMPGMGDVWWYKHRNDSPMQILAEFGLTHFPTPRGKRGADRAMEPGPGNEREEPRLCPCPACRGVGGEPRRRGRGKSQIGWEAGNPGPLSARTAEGG